MESRRTLITFGSVSQKSRRYKAAVTQRLVLHHFQSLQFIPEFTSIYALNPRETRPLDCSRCASNENTFSEDILNLATLGISVWVRYIRTVSAIFFFFFNRGKPLSVLCLENLFWQRISLKANPEGCLPPVQLAFNLFLSPAKVHPFLKPSSSRVLPTVVFCHLMQVEPKTPNMLKPKVCEMAETQIETQRPQDPSDFSALSSH